MVDRIVLLRLASGRTCTNSGNLLTDDVMKLAWDLATREQGTLGRWTVAYWLAIMDSFSTGFV